MPASRLAAAARAAAARTSRCRVAVCWNGPPAPVKRSPPAPESTNRLYSWSGVVGNKRRVQHAK